MIRDGIFLAGAFFAAAEGLCALAVLKRGRVPRLLPVVVLGLLVVGVLAFGTSSGAVLTAKWQAVSAQLPGPIVVRHVTWVGHRVRRSAAK